MIAVLFTLLFALYILGPDAFSRVILGFTIPRRSIQLSRSEEISRALLWAAFSVSVAYLWARVDGTLARFWQPASLKVCFAGIYSDAFFTANRDLWFGSVSSFLHLNYCLLWRTYFVVLVVSILLSALTHFYGVIRNWLPQWTWLREAFAAIILPRVAHWHVLLSRLLLAERSLSIHIDILTKADKLFQGEFAEKALASDGTLVSVTLANPRRFDREAYLRTKQEVGSAESEQFWKKIPTNIFLILGSEIHTMNLRYLPRDRNLRPLKAGSTDLTNLLRTIADQVREAQRQASAVQTPRTTVTEPGSPPPES